MHKIAIQKPKKRTPHNFHKSQLRLTELVALEPTYSKYTDFGMRGNKIVTLTNVKRQHDTETLREFVAEWDVLHSSKSRDLDSRLKQ